MNINDEKRLKDLFGINSGSIKPLEGSKEIFSCNAGETERMLRISNYKRFDEQISEAEWINHIFNNGILVAQVLKSKNENLCEKIIYNGISHVAMLFTKAKGTKLKSAEWDSDLLVKIGQIIGKMHNLAEIYKPENNYCYIKDWYEQKEYKYNDLIPGEYKSIHAKCRTVYEYISSLPRSPETYGIIHSDVGKDNIFIDNSDITLIDFQDCEKHYYINDIAVFIYFAVENAMVGTDKKEYADRIIKTLLKGYRYQRDIDNFWLSQIAWFLKLRQILSLNICYCYQNIDKLDEKQEAQINSYKNDIENDVPFLELDFAQYVK
jgi:Ser/Thr protein kinase RdoA (MazF antagonist)